MRREFSFTDERRRRARDILASYPTPRSSVLPLLWLVREQEGYLPDGAILRVAELAGISETEVGEVASFYDMFARTPQPLHHIKVCRGLLCGMKDARRIIGHIESRLGTQAGGVSDDGRFRISAVECLGLCDKSPAMMVDDECYGDLTEEGVDGILRDLGAKF